MQTLPKFIKAVGIPEFADQMGIKLRTVISWSRQDRWPNKPNSDQIIELAKNSPYGPIDYNGIFASEEDPFASPDP